MLILLGVFHAIAGLAEVVDPDAYVTTENYVQVLERRLGMDPPDRRDHRLLRRLRDLPWGRVGRTVGVIIAIISAAAAFAWLPYAPVSAIAIIASTSP